MQTESNLTFYSSQCGPECVELQLPQHTYHEFDICCFQMLRILIWWRKGMIASANGVEPYVLQLSMWPRMRRATTTPTYISWIWYMLFPNVANIDLVTQGYDSECKRSRTLRFTALNSVSNDSTYNYPNIHVINLIFVVSKCCEYWFGDARVW